MTKRHTPGKCAILRLFPHALSALVATAAFASSDDATLSFADFRPIPEVAAEKAAPAPEADVKALGEAWAAKDWSNVVARCDALLAVQGTATADRLAWTDRRREALECLGRWEDALGASLLSLGYPMPSNSLHAARMRTVRLLRDKLNRKDEAIALCLELMADESIPADWRAEAGRFAASTENDRRNASAAMDILLKVDALPTSTKVRSDNRWALVRHCLFYVRPMPEDRVLELSADGATNAVFTIGTRVDCAIACLDACRKAAKAADRLVPVAYARALLKEAGGAISPRDAARVENAISLSLRAADSIAQEEAAASSRALLANTNAVPANRIAAAEYLAARMEKDGDFAGAVALLESCYDFPGLGAGDYFAIMKRIGGIYLLQDNLDAALLAYRSCLARYDTAEMRRFVTDMTADAYKVFFRYADARDVYLAAGNKLAAAKTCLSLLDDPATAARLFRETLADESRSRAVRSEAWGYVFDTDPAYAERYLGFLAGADAASTNAAIRLLGDKLCRNGNSAAYFGDFPAAVRLFAAIEALCAAGGLPIDFRHAQYGAMARCGVKDCAAAAKICARALERPDRYSPAERYQLQMMEAVIAPAGDAAALQKAIAAADAKFAGDLAPKERVSRIDRVGCAAMVAGNETLARALFAFRDSLYAPFPTRTYKVRYSAKPIVGLGSWDAIEPKPEVQLLDRSYGGNMDFLVTDVATGDRGEGISTKQGAKRDVAPTMQVAFDDYGIHFRFEAPDEKAADIAAGLLGGGSYEGYIAPGENQPYICLLMDLAPHAKLHLFNTTYNTQGHRRVTDRDPGLFESETLFTDKSTVSYFMLSWNAYATLVPEDGAVWDFENFLWGRSGSAAWNGSDSIHGRSTWGKLVFEMPEKARIAILRRVIFSTLKAYSAEKRTTGSKEGVIDHWQDPAVGDPAFYAAHVAPLVEKIDGYLPLITADMADADVVKVAEEILPAMRDFRFVVARLRARYLAEKLAE